LAAICAVSCFARRIRGGDALGDLAHLVAVLLLQFLQKRRPPDQGRHRARGQHLQRGGKSTVHVALGGELAHGEVSGPEREIVPHVGVLGDPCLGLRLGELDLQPVVLLVQAVDLVGERPGLGHQILQAGHGLARCGTPGAERQDEAE
jgi:hypothetical protein